MLIVKIHTVHVASIAAKVDPTSRGRSAHKDGVDATIKALAIVLLHGVTRGQTSDVNRGRGKVGVSDDLGDVTASDLESDITPDPRIDPETEAGWICLCVLDSLRCWTSCRREGGSGEERSRRSGGETEAK